MNGLHPTFRGLIRTKADLLRVVEACLQGTLSHSAREPRPKESNSLVEAGNTFVYEENASGFRHWKDHFRWISVEKEDGVEVFMCVPLVLRKVTANIVWGNTTHFLVSYQPVTSSTMAGLVNLSQVFDLRKLNPRKGLYLQETADGRRHDPASPRL